MRTVPFRSVLHAVAYKLGLDPDQSNFLTNQAIPIGTYIDQWVKRVWDVQDWPELVQTRAFVPDTNHIVSWGTGGSGPTFSSSVIEINRVLKVFLVDPSTTDAPIDTHYTLLDSGIHCGYEHGTNVWIRYMPPPPRFTAVMWQPDTTFSLNDVTYSPRTGQVYRSKVNGNLGHDPALTFDIVPAPAPNIQPPNLLPSEITTELIPGNPGLEATSKILEARFISFVSDVPLPNPPPNNARFFMEIVDENGGLLGDATHIADGVDTLDVILTDIGNQLIGVLAGFTVTVDTTNFYVRLEDDSNFRINQAFWGLFTQNNQNVPIVQIQALVDAVSTSDGTRQVITMPLTPDNVVPGAVYQLTFRDVSGAPHTVQYTSSVIDGTQQILNGLIVAIQDGMTTDPFFTDIFSNLDTTSDSAEFSSGTSVSLNAQMTLPGSPWWQLVPFPEVLCNQVERGAFGDLYKEWGQEDKGLSEEQLVPGEIQSSAGTFQPSPNPPLTSQQRALSRYKIG